MEETEPNEHEGWLFRHAMEETTWQHCWCVLTSTALFVYDTDSCNMLLEEYPISESTRTFLLSSKELPEKAANFLIEKTSAFLLGELRLTRGKDARCLACFDASCDASLKEWRTSIELVAAQSGRLEAYIDDFSDVENDTMARRCSLDQVDDLDWSALEAIPMRSLNSTASSATPLPMQVALSGPLAKRSSSASTGEFDEDKEELPMGNLSSIELAHAVDWTLFGRDREPDQDARGAPSDVPEGGPAAVGGRASERLAAGRRSGAAEDEQAATLSKEMDVLSPKSATGSVHEAIFGECW